MVLPLIESIAGKEGIDPVHFPAHVMTYGTVDDLRALEGTAALNDFREALDKLLTAHSIPTHGLTGR